MRQLMSGSEVPLRPQRAKAPVPDLGFRVKDLGYTLF